MTTSASGAIVPANSITGEWRRFGHFLKRPTLPPRAPMPRVGSIVAVLRMLLLDFAIMAVLLAIAGAVMAGGVDLPETALAGMEMTTGIILAAVIAAPLLEEIAFRGWLSGRPGHILALLALVGVPLLATMAMGAAGFSYGTDALESGLAAMGLGGIAGLIAALALLFALRKRDAMGWFQRVFPGFFWLSTLAFSLIHTFNFPADQMVMALPLVLPQFATGAILGYLRVNYGLWSSILMHLLHNAAFIGLVVLASEAAS